MVNQVQIKSSSDPYELDYVIVKKDIKLPALTEKNARFIEAVVRLDSNYARDFCENEPDSEFDPEINAQDAKGKYCGSSAYWFKKMKEDGTNFKKCVLGAVIAVDTVNSTHLEACNNGRREARDIICDYCHNCEDLVKKLNVPYSADKNHILSLLCQPMDAKNKKGKRYNLSFASKFCSYAAELLNANLRYSKYDDVVSDILPLYADVYLGRKYPKGAFKIKYGQKGDVLQQRLDLYSKYDKCIDDILNTLKGEKIFLKKEELDHIIWYGYKG